MFGEIDDMGNPRKGALFAGRFNYVHLLDSKPYPCIMLTYRVLWMHFAGALMTIFATFVPFSYLDDFVSAGILIAFTVTNCSLVIMRRESPEGKPNLLQKLLAWFNLFSFSTSLAFTHLPSPLGITLGLLLGSLSVFIATKISRVCPPTRSFGNATSKAAQFYGEKEYFSTPLVPYIPCLGMFANYFLIAQLSFLGIGLLVIYAFVLVLLYFCYGARNSIGRMEGWDQQQHYSMVEAHENRDQSSTAGVIT